MKPCRYVVVSGYGAWGPDPDGSNKICDMVNAATSVNASDENPQRVRAKLNELVPQEVQEKYKLEVKANPGRYGKVPLPEPEFYDPVYER